MPNITVILPACVGIAYFITGLVYVWRKQYDWATIWLGYAIAQVGLVIAGNK